MNSTPQDGAAPTPTLFDYRLLKEGEVIEHGDLVLENGLAGLSRTSRAGFEVDSEGEYFRLMTLPESCAVHTHYVTDDGGGCLCGYFCRTSTPQESPRPTTGAMAELKRIADHWIEQGDTAEAYKQALKWRNGLCEVSSYLEILLTPAPRGEQTKTGPSHGGVFCCERKSKCTWQAFALHQGLGWGTPEGHLPEWVSAHKRECGGRLIQIATPSTAAPEEAPSPAPVAEFDERHDGECAWRMRREHCDCWLAEEIDDDNQASDMTLWPQSKPMEAQAPLVWTKEKPTESGWYLHQVPGGFFTSHGPTYMDETVTGRWQAGVNAFRPFPEGTQWYGPIPLPASPDNSQEGK